MPTPHPIISVLWHLRHHRVYRFVCLFPPDGTLWDDGRLLCGEGPTLCGALGAPGPRSQHPSGWEGDIHKATPSQAKDSSGWDPLGHPLCTWPSLSSPSLEDRAYPGLSPQKPCTRLGDQSLG